MAATDDFPGPKYAGPQAQRFRAIAKVTDRSTELCTGCGMCTSVCPNDVAISDIITVARSVSLEGGSSLSFGQRILNRPDWIGRSAGSLPGLANVALRNPVLRRVAEALFGIHRSAPLPEVRGPLFRRWFHKHSQPEGPKLLYFPGCAVDHFDPETGMATVSMLNRLGYQVRLPGGSCCSLPMLSSGEWRAAERRAKRLVADLASCSESSEALITSSTSCGLTLKSKYSAYLGMNDPSARWVASSTRDICEFLRSRGIDSLLASARPLADRIFYHPPCQLRGLGIGFPALELLREHARAEVIISEQGCCGIAGTYGYRKDRYCISNAIAGSLSEQITAVRPDIIACDSETCRWHLQALTGITAVHPVRILGTMLSREESFEVAG
jgi:glycerol-3-phosphate dehydrogenase subunit C